MAEIVLPQEIQEQLLRALQDQDPHVQVQIRRTSLGWLKLRVVTTCFEETPLPEREQQIDVILAPLGLNLGKFPFSTYDLLTPEEDKEQPSLQYIQLPLWSEILMAPEPDQPAPPDEDTFKRPFVVTFYSFKGGVGRTTALGLVAGLLAARKRRVVMVDFDLEAPGLSLMFPSEPGGFGALDYLHQRYLTPDQDVPPIDGCIRQVELQTRGELYLVPAGEYDEGYIHRLADLDMRAFYQREINPVHQLLNDIKAKLEPDVILIDARTGFDETSAVALFDLADLGFLCFSPSDQSFSGLRWVVQAARKQRDYSGKPDLRFLLTPIPPAHDSQLQQWFAEVEDWIEDHWGVPSSMMTSELYNVVFYNQQIPLLSSLVNDVPSDLLASYMPTVDVIDASLPDTKSEVMSQIPKDRDSILSELEFRAATAQDMKSEDIPTIFQRTEDFSRFLDSNMWLIRGAKGVGKSLLFRLFVEQPSDAREQAAQSSVDLGKVHFIPGHGLERLKGPILNSSDLRSYEQQVDESGWQYFWLNYMLLRLCHVYDELRTISSLDSQLVSLSEQERPRHSEIVDWLVQRARSPKTGPQAGDELRAIDGRLQQRDERIWLFYDELDAGFGTTQQDYDRRSRALKVLFAWWLESGRGLTNITPKILLREDIWSKFQFTNKGHYAGLSLQLRWDEADLWRLVLRQALTSSNMLKLLLEQQLSISLEKLDNSDVNLLRRSLYPLWGERMGRGNKAYTYNWVRNRITDTRNNRFPRSLVLLLQRATRLEEEYTTTNPYETILRPRALINALPFVSEQRVDEVQNEYPEFGELLKKLDDERSPVAADRLGEIWDRQGKELTRLIGEMVEAGIMQEYRRSPETDVPRYAVAELYLYGLGMKRKGQR